MLLKIINESLSLLLALGAGIYAYAYMDKFTKLLFYQLIAWLLFFILSRIETHYQVIHHIAQNNLWIFNIYMPFETLLLLLAARFYFKDQARKRIAVVLYLFFLAVWLMQAFLSGGIIEFLNFGFATEAVIVTILYLLVLYDFFAQPVIAWKTSPAVWASIGLVLFFACNVPYMSLLNYLNTNHRPLSEALFHFITDVLANVRHVCCALAFLMVPKNKLTIST